jgi:hypothetical protein
MRFTKKPFEVEAVQFTGCNFSDVIEFTRNKAFKRLKDGVLMLPRQTDGRPDVVLPDYWVVKDKGELSVCKDSVFKATYNPVKEKKPRKRSKLTDPPAGHCTEFDCPF